MYGSILIPILLEKFPEELNLIINRELNGSQAWNIFNVLEILKNEISARENTRSNYENFRNPITANTLYANGTDNRFSNEFNQNLRQNNFRNQNFSTKLITCVYCLKNHKSHYCNLVTDVVARKNILIEKRCCFRCLRESHSSKNCRSNFRSFKCDKPHHISICDSFKESNKFDNNSKTGQLTAVADVFSKINQHSKEINIKTFGNNNTNEILDRVKVYDQDNDGADIEIICFVKEICSPLNGQYIETASKNYKHLKYLKLAEYHKDNEYLEYDILIGADYYWSIIENNIIRGFEGPIAIKSKVGYLVSGPITGKNNNKIDCSVLSSHVLKVKAELYNDKTFLKDKLLTIWNKSKDNISDNLVVEHFRKSINFENNRYTVELPFKENHPLLCDNYSLCLKRFKSLERKFLKDAKLFDSYNDIIKEQLLNGTVEQVLNSYICLHWIKNSYKIYETFIQNRLEKIRDLFDFSFWDYVETYRNPADIISFYPNVPPLPLSRVNDDYVFKYTGIDYCGPLFVKNIYSEGEIFKCWILLASCASTRFIHLDLVPDCSA
ncbi:uncharacterized protein LOC136083084 [Hydra vulgaris]|uniref:Uncharacterized protein LOC136083084 n=1 Tax=Hydra vulgaris TaxID=6087 RepID=A0ABM4CA90_HYDVU